jgi:hypothetical protein
MFDDDYYAYDNIYGNGFYTTKDIEIAKTYTKKGATSRNSEGFLYKFEEPSPQKVFDLDKVLNFKESVGLIIKNVLLDMKKNGFELEVVDEILYDIKNLNTNTLGEVMDYGRNSISNLDSRNSFLDSFRDPLSKEGYVGYTHIGGVLTDGKRHTVKIYWTPENSIINPDVNPSLLNDRVLEYQIVNDSQASAESLRMVFLKEEGLSSREARQSARYIAQDQIDASAAVTQRVLYDFLYKDMVIKTPAGRAWSSKILQQIWEVATPQQKGRILMQDNLEQLGLERIARSNVIDDHLPPEGVFDTPC